MHNDPCGNQQKHDIESDDEQQHDPPRLQAEAYALPFPEGTDHIRGGVSIPVLLFFHRQHPYPFLDCGFPFSEAGLFLFRNRILRKTAPPAGWCRFPVQMQAARIFPSGK